MKYDPTNTPNIGRTADGRPIVVDEQVAEGIRGTILNSDLLTPVIQEVYNAITMSGLEASYDNTQLYQVLSRMNTAITNAQNSIAGLQGEFDNLPSEVAKLVNQQLAGLDATIQSLKDQATVVQNQIQQELKQDMDAALAQLNQEIEAAKNSVAASTGDLNTRLGLLKEELEGEMHQYVMGEGLPAPTGGVPEGTTRPGVGGDAAVDEGTVYRSLAYKQSWSPNVLGIYTYNTENGSAPSGLLGDSIDRPVVVDQYPGMVARGRPLALQSDLVSITAQLNSLESSVNPLLSRVSISGTQVSPNASGQNFFDGIGTTPYQLSNIWIDYAESLRYGDITNPTGMSTIQNPRPSSGGKAPYLLSGGFSQNSGESYGNVNGNISLGTPYIADQTSTLGISGYGAKLYTGGNDRPLYQDDIGDGNTVKLRTRPLATYSDITSLQAQIGAAIGAGTSSFTSAGYQKLPSGLILQWMTMPSPWGGTFNFPITFPTACLAIIAGNASGQGSDADAAFAYSVSTSSFVAGTWWGGTTGFAVAILAIGY